MPARDRESRVLVAQIAAAERWGRTPDRTAATAPARAGLRAKFAREIDPYGALAKSDPAELERRVDQLHHAHMLRMSLKAKAARKKATELRALEAELAANGVSEPRTTGAPAAEGGGHDAT